MNWQYSRVDFLPSHARCFFCHRPLTRTKGIIIRDELGAENFAGANCAKKHLGDIGEPLLDVTKMALLVVADEGPVLVATAKPAPAKETDPATNDPAPPAPPARPPLPPVDQVVQYVRLRAEFMSKFRYSKGAVITTALEELSSTGEISESTRKKIAGAMRNAESQNSVLSERNIKKCIGMQHWLDEAIEHTNKDRREFLERMLQALHAHWHLTRGQLAAINKWGEILRKGVEDFPLLSESCFDGVTVPDFMVRKAKH